jgi:hypothetical protein
MGFDPEHLGEAVHAGASGRHCRTRIRKIVIIASIADRQSW